MHTLYLTGEERIVFSKLPKELTSNLHIETEVIEYEDSPKSRAIRFEFFHPTDPEIIRFRDSAKSCKTKEDIVEVVKKLDMKKIGDADFTQMLFALGPGALELIIDEFLSSTASATDIEIVAAYSMLRHDMLESLDQYSPKEP